MKQEFTIGLEGIRIRVGCFYERTSVRCRDYLTGGKEDLKIVISREDLERERQKNSRECEPDKEKTVSGAQLEMLARYRQIAEKMPWFDTWLMHGSAVCAEGEAVLFTAPSGVGKSTHTALWLEQISGSFVVNGDKPLLSLHKEGCFVCGTPWAGKEGWYRNVLIPLKAICLLGRGTENRIREISFQEAFPMLLQQSYRPEDTAALEKTLELLHRLEGTVRFYSLMCNRDPEAARTAYGSIYHGEEKNEREDDIV